MPNSLNRSVRGKSRSRDEKKADESVDQFILINDQKTLTARCSYRHCFEFAVIVKVGNYFEFIILTTTSLF